MCIRFLFPGGFSRQMLFEASRKPVCAILHSRLIPSLNSQYTYLVEQRSFKFTKSFMFRKKQLKHNYVLGK
jgi:hypothetical protein